MRMIAQGLNHGWVSVDYVQEKWLSKVLEHLDSEKARVSIAAADLLKAMRLADIKEREIALKEQQAEDAKRLRLLKQLAGLDPRELASRAKAIGITLTADGRAGQPIGADGSQAGQSKGHQDPGTEGLEGEKRNA